VQKTWTVAGSVNSWCSVDAGVCARRRARGGSWQLRDVTAEWAAEATGRRDVQLTDEHSRQTSGPPAATVYHSLNSTQLLCLSHVFHVLSLNWVSRSSQSSSYTQIYVVILSISMNTQIPGFLFFSAWHHMLYAIAHPSVCLSVTLWITQKRLKLESYATCYWCSSGSLEPSLAYLQSFTRYSVFGPKTPACGRKWFCIIAVVGFWKWSGSRPNAEGLSSMCLRYLHWETIWIH